VGLRAADRLRTALLPALRLEIDHTATACTDDTAARQLRQLLGGEKLVADFVGTSPQLHAISSLNDLSEKEGKLPLV
jgi:hypothetical protein